MEADGVKNITVTVTSVTNEKGMVVRDRNFNKIQKLTAKHFYNSR